MGGGVSSRVKAPVSLDGLLLESTVIALCIIENFLKRFFVRLSKKELVKHITSRDSGEFFLCQSLSYVVPVFLSIAILSLKIEKHHVSVPYRCSQ